MQIRFFLNESGLFQILYQHWMHELVLGHSLHHEHSLLPQMTQNLWNVDVDVVVDAVQQNVAQNRDAGSTDAGWTVDENWRVATLGWWLRGLWRRRRRARQRRRRRHDVLPQRSDFFEKLEVSSGVGRAAVIAPVGVVKVPESSRTFCRHVDHLQGGGGVAPRPWDAGELFGDSKVCHFQGRAVLLRPVGNAVTGRQLCCAVSALK